MPAAISQTVQRSSHQPRLMRRASDWDAARQKRLARRLEAGMVGINTVMLGGGDSPFGGAKWSGHGSEDGLEGVLACMITKAVHEA